MSSRIALRSPASRRLACVPSHTFRGSRSRSRQRPASGLATGLTERPGSRWSSATFESPRGLYVTNAVKRYLPHATGRWAAHVHPAWFTEGSRVRREELRLLARRRAFPDVMVVFGARAWWPTCSVLLDLCNDGSEQAFVRYESVAPDSDVFHRLNVVHVADGGADRPCVVVRLDHPAARRRWTAERMLERRELWG